MFIWLPISANYYWYLYTNIIPDFIRNAKLNRNLSEVDILIVNKSHQLRFMILMIQSKFFICQFDVLQLSTDNLSIAFKHFL